MAKKNGSSSGLRREAARRQAAVAARAALTPAGPPSVTSAPGAGNHRQDALDALVVNADLLRSAQRRQDRLVVDARGAGATWTSIARALGVSPQAVQQRYSRVGVSPGSEG